MCNMLVATDREEILKLAEEMAVTKINKINKDLDDDNEMDSDQTDDLKDCIDILKCCVKARIAHFQLEERTAARLETWRKSMCTCNGGAAAQPAPAALASCATCAPTPASAPLSTTPTPTAVPVAVNRG